jgi:methyl-accepting chemotaxis protein
VPLLRFVDSVLALGASGALVLIAGAAYGVAKGTLASRLVLAFVQVGLVALLLQLAQGMPEFHFGVFVTLARLLVYLDWRAPSCGPHCCLPCTMCCSTVCRRRVSVCIA